MAASISTANITNFSSDPCITHSASSESNDDMAGVIVKEEALCDELLLNCDSIEEFYEFADTSLPIDLECSELIKECSILNINKTPKHSSILLTLLPTPTLKSYQQTYKHAEDTWNTNSKSPLKLNVVGNQGEIDKCDKQPTLTKSVKVDKEKVVYLGPHKSENETVGSLGSQSSEHQFKCIHCNRIFGHESHLKMHMIGHNRSESCSLSPEQEIFIVKEEVLSDDEGALNYASVSECENNGYISCPMDTKFLEVDGNNSVALENKTDCGSNIIGVLTDSALENFNSYKDLNSDLGIHSEPVKQLLGNNSDAIRKLESYKNCGRSVKVNGKKVKWQLQLKTKPVTAPSYAAVPPEHRFQCQECSETFELKSHLVMHEIGHEKYRKYGPYARYHFSRHLQPDKPIYQCKECNVDFELKSWFTLGNNSDAIRKLESYKNCGRSVKVNGKKVKWQLQLKTKPVTAPSYAAVPPEHRFQCQECSETFELKSHLVMHEIGHEKYRKYGPYARYHFSRHLRPDKPIYQCKECNVDFELKSWFTLHELMHDKQRTKPCHCRSASLASASDLCTCVVRVCLSCCRRFFASCRLRNWTLCVKCFLPGASKGYVNSSTAVKTEKIKGAIKKAQK